MNQLEIQRALLVLRCSLTCYWALNHNNEIYAKIYHKLSFSRLLMIDMGVDVDTISYFVYTFFSYFIFRWNIFFYVFNIMECKLEFQWNCEEKTHSRLSFLMHHIRYESVTLLGRRLDGHASTFFVWSVSWQRKRNNKLWFLLRIGFGYFFYNFRPHLRNVCKYVHKTGEVERRRGRKSEKTKQKHYQQWANVNDFIDLNVSWIWHELNKSGSE